MTSVRVFAPCALVWAVVAPGGGWERPRPAHAVARKMLGNLSSWAADPLGLVDEPASITERLRAELKELRAGLRTIIEANQGIPMEKPNDAKGLIGCLEELIQDQKDEMTEKNREVATLRHTVAMLQQERRRSCIASAAGASVDSTDGAVLPHAEPSAASPLAPARPPPAPPPPPPPSESESQAAKEGRSPGRVEREMNARVAAAAEAAAEAAAIRVRSEERARCEARLAAAEREYVAREARALQAEREATKLKLTSHAATLGQAAEAEVRAIATILSIAIGELETRMRSQAEGYQTSLAQTKQRAAQMLAKKDAALLQLRQAGFATASATDATLSSGPSGSSCVEAARSAAAGGAAAASASAAPACHGRKSAVVSIGVGTSDDEATRFLEERQQQQQQQQQTRSSYGGSYGGSYGSKFANGGGLGGSPMGSSDVTARFARRAAELEATVASLREANHRLEAAQAEDDKRKKALRVRLLRLERAQENGADLEYLRNVLLQWFTMPPSGRGALFPVIAAAASFSKREIADINRARMAQAPGIGSWLWGGGGDGGGGGAFFSDGVPPATPLAMPPAAPAPREPSSRASDANGRHEYARASARNEPPASARLVTPANGHAGDRGASTQPKTGAGGGGGGGSTEVVALREKVAKLRWLLQCANAEITRLRQEAEALEASGFGPINPGPTAAAK